VARSRTELDPRFRRLMQRLDSAMTEPVTRAIAESSKKVHADAVARIPVDTGALKHSIGIKLGKGELSGTVGFSRKEFPTLWAPRLKKRQMEAAIAVMWAAALSGYGGVKLGRHARGGSQAAGWRAKFVELGTKGSPKDKIPAQSKRPFLRPAFEANRRWIMERHKQAVQETLARAASL
jgi:HK97 gp10 family phage protein